MNDLAPINPGNYDVVQNAETASSAVAAQAKALVEARYIMAIRRPRDMDAVRERMLKECRRPSFAAVARYRKPIGKDQSKWPTGPSIRFAESAVRNMTNITVETMTVYDDRQKRIVRVTVTDLEANVPYSQDITIEKTIERRQFKEGDTVLRQRTNSYGDKVFILEATDDDIVNKQAALISKAVRTLGMRLIPGDIVDECMEIVVETQRNADAQDPDAAKRKLFDGFGSIGVRVDQLKEYLGHDAGTLSPKELQDLRELYAAIRDGESTWREVMDTKDGGEKKTVASGGSAGLKAAMAAGQSAGPAAAAPAAPATAASQANPATGETTPPPATSKAAADKTAASKPAVKADGKKADDGAPKQSYAQFVDRIQAATSAETAALELDAARGVLTDLECVDLAGVYGRRWPTKS